MANTAQGLETPSANEQVNTQAGFEAALARKGVEPAPEDRSAADTSIQLGLETVDPAQQRGPDGRFTAAPKDTPAAPVDTSAGEGAIVFASDDPEIQGILEKYNGDPEAALRGLANAQALIGRRDEEREALAQKVAELTGMVTVLQQGVQTAATPTLTNDQVEEQTASLIQSKGYAGAATDAANLAHATGDERAYRAVLDQWAIEEPAAAMDFNTDFRLWQRDQRTAAAGPQVDPRLVAMADQRDADDAISTIATERGEQWAAIAPYMLTALEAMPKAVVDMVASNDPEAKLEGTRLVADRATLLAAQGAAASQGSDGNGAGEMPPSVQRKLLGASVATGALRPAPQAQGGQKTREESIVDFKKQILAAETTSVASGLTFGAANR